MKGGPSYTYNPTKIELKQGPIFKIETDRTRLMKIGGHPQLGQAMQLPGGNIIGITHNGHFLDHTQR